MNNIFGLEKGHSLRDHLMQEQSLLAVTLVRRHTVEHVTVDGIEAGGELRLPLLAHEGDRTFRVRVPVIAWHAVGPRAAVVRGDQAEGTAFLIVRRRDRWQHRSGG